MQELVETSSACDRSRSWSTLGPHSARTVLTQRGNGPGDRAPPKHFLEGQIGRSLASLRAQFGRAAFRASFRFPRACRPHHPCAPCNAGAAAAQRHRDADALGPDSQMRENRGNGNGRPHRTIYWRITDGKLLDLDRRGPRSRQGRELSGSGTGTVPCVRPAGHRVDSRSRSTLRLSRTLPTRSWPAGPEHSPYQPLPCLAPKFSMWSLRPPYRGFPGLLCLVCLHSGLQQDAGDLGLLLC